MILLGLNVLYYLEVGLTCGFFFWEDMGPLLGVGGLASLYATGTILNTTSEVENS